MTMNKMFAGLIAFVAGVALSAGSAFATKGYMSGDPAMMKLIPYYETGDNRATLIAIQNLSSQEAETVALNQDVTDLEAYLGGADATQAMVDNLNADNITLTADVVLDQPILKTDLNEVNEVEEALEKAKGLTYIEHVFVTVNVYDAMGMMMDGASATLCLAENQSGFVVLQGPEMQDWQMEIPNQGMYLSVMDGDIPAYGYVKIMAGSTKYQACSSATPAGIKTVVTPLTTITTDADTARDPAMSEVAAWAIVQDTGMGFFGTEIPTATISMADKVGMDSANTAEGKEDDGDPEVACYSVPNYEDGGTAPDAADQLLYGTGNFMTSRCGLIPERHTMGALNATTTTNNANAFARYDTMGDDSTVYVWLAKGMDMDDTLPRNRRMLEVTVMCMDGSMPAGPDRNGDNKPDPIMVAAPNMITMIDPGDMDGVGMYTDMCDDSRGVLKIMMPNNSHAGMVFTHITQAGNSYRMNFPGYSMAPNMDFCSAALPTVANGGPTSACK